MIERIKYKNHDEWLDIRKMGVGGSEAGIIMGCSEYGSLLTLWSDKMGIGEPVETNLAMKMGTALEPLVASEFSERSGKTVRERHYMMRNTRYPWAIGNIDRRIIGENALLECKTTGSIPRIRSFRTGEYPDAWYCQCQHYMAVGEFDRAYLACINRNLQGEYVSWVINRDDDFISQMMEKERMFWDMVQGSTPPVPTGNERESGILQAMYPVAGDTDQDISDIADEIDKYKEYGDLEKRYKQLKDAAKNTICLRLGGASIGTVNGNKVCSWKTVNKSEYVVKASSSRQFRLLNK